mmetsp:Transcript_15052/g.40390  ORF Transcript_15052/g.40390 Transcript_15052/m.40390 type:complete len:127 (+) Transcript_15052:2260-2640(+)
MFSFIHVLRESSSGLIMMPTTAICQSSAARVSSAVFSMLALQRRSCSPLSVALMRHTQLLDGDGLHGGTQRNCLRRRNRSCALQLTSNAASLAHTSGAIFCAARCQTGLGAATMSRVFVLEGLTKD